MGEYCDEGVSGAKNSRPGLDRLLADAEMGKFSIILVWKLDRLGRSLVHLVRLMEDCRRLGIELVSFSEGLDFTTTTGKLLYQIICAFADYAERTIMRSHWAEVPFWPARQGFSASHNDGSIEKGFKGTLWPHRTPEEAAARFTLRNCTRQACGVGAEEPPV